MVRCTLVVMLSLAAVCAAQPVHKRSPQDGQGRPGFFPEITSLLGSLYGDGETALISAIYGDTSASSALNAATSAAAAGDDGAAASYWSEATQAVGSQWSQATEAANDQWTSYTSAYDANNGGATSSWTPEPTSIPTSASTANIPNASASQTGGAMRSLIFSSVALCEVTGVFVVNLL